MKKSEGKLQSRVLFISVPFTTKYGGLGPSILFTAYMLKKIDIASDVLDKYGLIKNIQDLDSIPEKRSSVSSIGGETDYSSYDLFVYVSQWHSILNFFKAWLFRKKGSKIISAPKGALCKIEFTRFRDFKKFIYFSTLGWPILVLSNVIIYSSKLERENSILPEKIFGHRSMVIPEYYCKDVNDLSAEYLYGSQDANKIIRFSFLAEITPRKGLLELVYGIVELLKNREEILPYVHFSIGGEAKAGSLHYLDKAKSVIRKANLEKVVSFIGRVSAADKKGFYCDTDVFLAVSRFESYGLTLLEALSSSCWVVANRQLGVLEFLSTQSAMCVVYDLSKEQLSEALYAMYISACRVDKNEIQDAGVVDYVNAIALENWRLLFDSNR